MNAIRLQAPGQNDGRGRMGLFRRVRQEGGRFQQRAGVPVFRVGVQTSEQNLAWKSK